MKKKIIALSIALVAIVVIAVACVASKDEPEPIHTLDSTEPVGIIDSSMNSAIDKIIAGEDTTGDPCVATPSPIYINLMCDNYEIVDRYYGDHALFVKIKETTGNLNDYTMLRFQLNNENKIIDCIAFNIAG